LNVYTDFGYGFLKALTDHKEIIFPSVSGEMQTTAFSLSDNDTGLGITTDDGAWLFGQSAMEQSILSSQQQNVDWVLSPEYKAGILLAVTELTKASRVDIELTLALPYETVTRKEIVKQLINNLRGEHTVKPLGGNSQQITASFPQRFPIVPQNVAPVLRHMIDKHGNLRLPETNSDVIYIGLCNGGSHTVELSTCRIVLKTRDFKELKGRSEPIGTFALSEIVRPLLQERFPDEQQLFKRDHRLFDILKTGNFTPYNQVHSVDDLVNEPKDQYCQRITALCNEVWSDVSAIKKPELWGFVASGGGAHIFVEALEKWHPNVVISENPQWDVVEGCRRLRKMLEKEG
jgi:hypothetical protein